MRGMTAVQNEPARRGPGRPGHDLRAVIAAGTRVFTERGYAAATMDHVAAELGVSKSALYHHVSGKADILDRALGVALDALEEALVAAAASPDPANIQLARLVRQSVRIFSELRPNVTLLLRLHGNSDVERAALQRRRALDTALARIVAHAQADGSIATHDDPLLLARLIFGTVNSLTGWYRSDDPAAQEETANALTRFVFGGIASSSPPS